MNRSEDIVEALKANGINISLLEEKEIIQLPSVTCQVCKKDWTKCTRCLVMMKWIKEHKSEVEE